MNVGLLGYGVVGKGVDELLSRIEGFAVTKVFDLPKKKDELGERYCASIEAVLEDPSIDAVIECLGGDELPYRAIKGALKAGKHVITSNKLTVATHLDEYVRLAKENGVTLQMEASCMGGVPLVYPLLNVAEADEALNFQGILNGTSNYLLTQMEQGVSYESALKEAQAKGFAEADPSSDVKGYDSARKIAILSSILLHGYIAPEKVVCFGMDMVSISAIEDAKKRGNLIRLIASMQKENDGVSLLVCPTEVKKDSSFGQTKNELNLAYASFENNGPLTFSGYGAGRYPTAMAIVQDALRLLRGGALMPSLDKAIQLASYVGGAFLAYDESGKATRLENPKIETLKGYAALLRLEEKPE